LNLNFFINPQTIGNPQFINHIPALNITKAAKEYIPAENSNVIANILLIIFISGGIVCLTRFLIQLLSFKKITSKATLISYAYDVKLYHLDSDIMPFSFGNAVYVNKYKHTSIELDDIIKHESVHVHQQHTIDVIIAELICVLNWYNPFVWFIKNAIKQNLEFLADDVVIKDGTDKKSYQYLLLKVTGYSPLNIVSSFKLSSLKQRIYMMNKTKTSQKHLLKLFFVLPLIAVIMLAFRDNDTYVSNTISNNKEDTFMLSELSYNIQDANVNNIVKQAQEKSLLQAGKPFTIGLIRNERDRLKLLLENNGYNNIDNHAITFLIDSSLTNNSFAVQVNINLQQKESSYNIINQATGSVIAGSRNAHLQITQNNYDHISPHVAADEQARLKM
jgi:hypothetical protein